MPDSFLKGSTDNDLALRLQYAIDGSGTITRRALERDFNVSRSAITKWLRTGHVSKEYLIGFEEFYGLSLRWLLTGHGPMFLDEDSASISEKIYSLGDKIAQNQSGILPIRVEDHSLSGLAAPSDILMVDCDRKVTYPGQITLLSHNESGRLYLRVHREQWLGHIIFVSLDQFSPCIPYADCSVIGIGIEKRSKLDTVS